MTALAVVIAQNMAPIMFLSLVLILLLGYPVAFSLGFCGLGFFIIGVLLAPFSDGAISLSLPMLQALPDRVFGVMTSETMLAIPFFTLMGFVLERSGMAEDLLETAGELFGSVRGGLGYAVILVGALLAATTGVVAASVISMGLISLPVMLRHGYDRRLAAGLIAASGTLAQIIPPALVLIVMAEQLQRSVGDLYEAALGPGLMLAGLYGVFLLAVTLVRPDAAPALPRPAHPNGDDVDDKVRAQISGAIVAAVGAVAFIVFLVALARRGALSEMLSGAAGAAISIPVAVWGAKAALTKADPRGAVSMVALVLIAGGAGVLALPMLPTPAVAVVVAVAAAATFVAADGVARRTWGIALISRLARRVVVVMVPPLFLIFLVLGSIFVGFGTPTEGGAMGVLGALLLAFAYRAAGRPRARFGWAELTSAVHATAKLCAFAMFILIGARVFSLTFYALAGQRWVEHLLVSLPGGRVGFLIFVNAMIFLLAFFLEFFELAFIVIPLLVAPAEALGVDLVWLGVVLALNIQTSFMHPPFGYSLFYLRSVAPAEEAIDAVTGRLIRPVTTGQIYVGAIPFVAIQCVMVALLIAFPGLAARVEKDRPAEVSPALNLDIK